MYKIVKVFQAKKKELEKEKKAHKRIKDSKEKDEPAIELAAITVAQSVQQQVRDFKVGQHCFINSSLLLKEALPVLMLCVPVFIFTSSSSALLRRPRCGLSI